LSAIDFGSGLSDDERKEFDSLSWIQQEDITDEQYARLQSLGAQRTKDDFEFERKRDLESELRFERERKFRIELHSFIASCLKKYSPNGTLTITQMQNYFKSEIRVVIHKLENEVVEN